MFYLLYRVAVWAARGLSGRTPGRDDPAGRCIEVWTGPHPGSTGRKTTHSEENIYKMDEFFLAKGTSTGFMLFY